MLSRDLPEPSSSYSDYYLSRPSDSDDAVRDACGVVGIFAPGLDVARLAYFGIFALQHRGQESAGIAVTDGADLTMMRDMGLVSQVFTEDDLARLKGFAAIGHTRYSTTGSNNLANAQPVVVETRFGDMAFAHNGNLINYAPIRAELQNEGVVFQGTSDSEVMAQLIAYESRTADSLLDAIRTAAGRMRGAFSVVCLTRDTLYAFRDPWGIRPLSLGLLNGKGAVVASESCALDVVGARIDHEIGAGEIIMVNADGITYAHTEGAHRPSMCMFEFIYIARPDTEIYDRSVHLSRRRMGQILAREHPAEADLVIAIPDTGTPAAIGYAEESRIPYGEGLIKNRYIHRTFIQPDQRLREMGVRMKLNPLREALEGKRVVVVEDSIVRGTTTRGILRLLREAGATEIHMRVSSPPYRFPCFFGVDTFAREHLIAAYKSIEEIREHIGADSLGYLSIEGLARAVNLPKGIFCTACLDGEYPMDLPRDVKLSKFSLEELADQDQLSLDMSAAANGRDDSTGACAEPVTVTDDAPAT